MCFPFPPRSIILNALDRVFIQRYAVKTPPPQLDIYKHMYLYTQTTEFTTPYFHRSGLLFSLWFFLLEFSPHPSTLFGFAIL